MTAIRIKRIYAGASKADGFRALVDRLWPRGISKNNAAIDDWAKEIAPSTRLRKWFNHDPGRWKEFQKRYRAELKDRASTCRALLKASGNRPLTLLYAAKDEQRNHAIVLRQFLSRLRSGRSSATHRRPAVQPRRK